MAEQEVLKDVGVTSVAEHHEALKDRIDSYFDRLIKKGKKVQEKEEKSKKVKKKEGV